MKTMIVLLFLGVLCSIGLTYQVNEGEVLQPKLPLRPGDLLRSLDALTSDAQVIYSPLQETPLQQAERRVYHDEDNQESGSEFDYDKAYENFVNKYFAKGEEDLDSEEPNDGDVNEKAEEIDEAQPYDFSVDEASSSSEEQKNEEQEQEKSSSGSKKCERVKIDNQNCKICEDSRTNEKSKTCSYSSNDKPKNYGYSKERSTKHSSDDEGENDSMDDKSSEIGRSLKRETTPPSNKSRFKPRRTSIEHILKPSVNDHSRCTRKLENGNVCFYCESGSENSRECLADKNTLKKRRLDLDESSKKDSGTKKIFKRMVTYSFKNDATPKFKQNTYSAVQEY